MVEFFEVTIKHGHERQFYEGMQKYKKCFADNKIDADWGAWWRMQGEGSTVVFTRNIANYAEFDTINEDEMKCQSVAESELIPNSTKIKRNFMSPMADWSVATPPEGKAVNVTYFEVSNPWQFMEAVGDVVNIVKDSEGYNAHWLSAVGGNDYDYAVVFFYDNFAEMDKQGFNPWKIYSEKQGEEKLKKVREKINSSVKNVDEFMYSFDESISYNGSASSEE